MQVFYMLTRSSLVVQQPDVHNTRQPVASHSVNVSLQLSFSLRHGDLLSSRFHISGCYSSTAHSTSQALPDFCIVDLQSMVDTVPSPLPCFYCLSQQQLLLAYLPVVSWRYEPQIQQTACHGSIVRTEWQHTGLAAPWQLPADPLLLPLLLLLLEWAY